MWLLGYIALQRCIRQLDSIKFGKATSRRQEDHNKRFRHSLKWTTPLFPASYLTDSLFCTFSAAIRRKQYDQLLPDTFRIPGGCMTLKGFCSVGSPNELHTSHTLSSTLPHLARAQSEQEICSECSHLLEYPDSFACTQHYFRLAKI